MGGEAGEGCFSGKNVARKCKLEEENVGLNFRNPEWKLRHSKHVTALIWAMAPLLECGNLWPGRTG